MPEGTPTKAPIIIFGTMVGMSIITVGIVFYTHSQRTEPYLNSKIRVQRVIRQPAPAATPPAAPAKAAPPRDAGVDGRSSDAN